MTSHSPARSVSRRRESLAIDNEEYERRRSDFYRRGSNISEASFMTDVEMATEEMFFGLMFESVLTVISIFLYRRSKRDFI
jgi:cation-transporting ATPase 13A3/4/5